jgi:hypothetical protein
MEISDPYARFLVYLFILYFLLSPYHFGFLLFLLSFITSLPHLALEESFDVVVAWMRYK